MSLDIIGPGFGRTGTYSLKIALEHLGYGPAHHMFEVRDNPPLLTPWQAFADGRTVDWDAAFKGYRAQVDWPGAAAWSQLAQHYPEAKVVLTVRDPNEWYDSIEKTIRPFIEGRGKHPADHPNAIAAMGQKLIVEQIFGDRFDDRRHAISVFNAHTAKVRESIPAERLLVFDVAEGWEPLCRFLGVPVPSISFPRLNSTRQFVEDEWAGSVPA